MRCSFNKLINKFQINIFKGTPSNIRKIQELLNNIELPHNINRKDFQINKILTWKASEYRTFFLYLALPVLKTVMLARPTQYLNMCCFVYGKNKVKDNDLDFIF